MALRCKFAELLGKNKEKISDVHRSTKINRNTLTALYNETATRIDFKTIEKLCAHFGCEVGELLEYITENRD